jgi:hypothetical protein
MNLRRRLRRVSPLAYLFAAAALLAAVQALAPQLLTRAASIDVIRQALMVQLVTQKALGTPANSVFG